MPENPEIYLRPYRDEDHDALIDLWHCCGLIVPANDPSRDIRLKLDRDPDGLIVGQAMDDPSRVVASVMIGYEGHRGWVNYLAVDPAYRRKGFGRALMEYAEIWLRKRDCPKLNLQVRTSNAAVIGFYEAMGYRQDAVVSMGKRFDS